MDVRVVWGTGRGPTELASYDVALAAAGVHNYNLVPVSSVLPAEAAVSVAGTAPDLGPAGSRLTVVEACGTTSGPGRVSAALGWAAGDGPGIVYEATVERSSTSPRSQAPEASEAQSASGSRPEAGELEERDARERVEQGLAAGRGLRDWDFSEARVESVTAEAESGTHATAVVLAAFGEGEPLG